MNIFDRLAQFHGDHNQLDHGNWAERLLGKIIHGRDAGDPSKPARATGTKRGVRKQLEAADKREGNTMAEGPEDWSEDQKREAEDFLKRLKSKG